MENGNSSYPPTERADISMNSLFSDSFEFDQAEKGKSDNVNGELDGRESNGLSERVHSANGRKISGDSISHHFTQLASILNKSNANNYDNDNVYAQLQRQKQKEEEGEMKDVYNLWSNTSLNNPPAPPLPEDNVPYMKPRLTALPAPIAWKPLHVKLTNDKDDEEKIDEFDVHTAKVPIMPYDSDNNTEVNSITTPADSITDNNNKDNENVNSTVAPVSKAPFHFKNGTPDMFGKMTSCFDEAGLLYRIVDQQERTWAFYNDSLLYEMHVTCKFGKHSKLEALDNTTLTTDESTNEFIASTVIYPCETERFVKGFVNGFTSRVRALPLSNSYHASRAKLQYNSVISNEIAAVRAIMPHGVTDAEEVLKACVKFNVPFVDLSFLPVQSSIDGSIDNDVPTDSDETNNTKKNAKNNTKQDEEEEEEGIKYKRLPWARPWMYLPYYARDQIRLFRNTITPGQMKRGDLGDSWFSCSIAALAENSNVIVDLFRHPVSAELGQRERTLGAYRVTFNKHGMWHSVIVDDYLPMLANIPRYASGVDQFEIWPAIIQKAYAKLHHSYSAIAAGDPVHSLTDLTGCSSMRIDLLFNSAAFHSQSQRTDASASNNNNNKENNKQHQQQEEKEGENMDISKASQDYVDLFTRLSE